ncbi:MAG: MFS transporter [Bacteroidota bacterium]
MKRLFPPERIISFSLLLVTLAVNISMPLFRVYAKEAGFGNGQTALVLAAYITGMLPCYIFLGGISDRIGRKPVLIGSVICSFMATLAITLFPNVYALVVARIFQGVALGLSMGTGTAYLAEVLHGKPNAVALAANKASFSTSIGFSGGALATTIVLLIHFTITPITYFGLLLLTFLGILLMFSLPDLKPKGGKMVRLPYFPKGSFPVNMAIAICWATTGIIIAIIPSQLSKLGLTAYAGFVIVLINWTGAFIQPLIRKMDPIKAIKVGYVMVPAGFAIVILGCHLERLPVILAGTTIIGLAAYGFSFMSGMTLIIQAAGEHRARAVSGFMFFGYIGFGIPAIFLGFLSDSLGIVNALLLFESIIILLSAFLFVRISRPGMLV